MNPAMLARTPVVVAQTARARLAPRHRVARAAAVKTTTVYESRRGAVRFGAVQQGHRTTTCNASSESNSEKTVSALDAILAGSTDDTEPEPEVPEPVVPRERKPGEVSDAMKAKSTYFPNHHIPPTDCPYCTRLTFFTIRTQSARCAATKLSCTSCSRIEGIAVGELCSTFGAPRSRRGWRVTRRLWRMF
jgi:hypothetical protein